MPNDLEMIKDTIEQFQRVQRHRLLAKKENATETYESMKNEYLSLKALLAVAGVNLTNIDEMKE